MYTGYLPGTTKIGIIYSLFLRGGGIVEGQYKLLSPQEQIENFKTELSKAEDDLKSCPLMTLMVTGTQIEQFGLELRNAGWKEVAKSQNPNHQLKTVVHLFVKEKYPLEPEATKIESSSSSVESEKVVSIKRQKDKPTEKYKLVSFLLNKKRASSTDE